MMDVEVPSGPAQAYDVDTYGRSGWRIDAHMPVKGRCYRLSTEERKSFQLPASYDDAWLFLADGRSPKETAIVRRTDLRLE